MNGRIIAAWCCMMAATATAAAGERTDSTEYDTFQRLRVGGYGEMVGSLKQYGTNRYGGLPQGSSSDTRATVAIPRMVLALDYKLGRRWVLGTEIEFESGGVGVETELESSENGEYETEMEHGGEVALEQFHITRLIRRGINLRVGHQILPLGLTNAHHEPINFFGTERPESETTFIPSTWHETGVSIFGTVGRGRREFNYQAMAVAGLNPDGFGRDHWVADGLQGIFEVDNFTSPAYVARLDYVGVNGLRTGASAYFCPNTGKNADKPHKYAKCGHTGVYILSADAQYVNRTVRARAHVMYGHLQNSDLISAVTMSNKSGYHSGAMRRVAQSALGYGAEVGANICTLLGTRRGPALYPFVRYEYVNPQQTAAAGSTVDERTQVSKWQAGLNWYALPNLVVKADYSNRRIGTQRVLGYHNGYNRENEFSIGIAYVGWFWQK